MPSMSSGEVSSRTRMTISPRFAASTASSCVKTIWPTAPPGEAGRPIASRFAFFSESGSRIGWRNSSNWEGETRMTAVFSSIIFSSIMSMAILRAATPVRLPIRHWSIQSLPSWIVNSMSCMSWKCSSSLSWMSSNCLYTSGIAFSSDRRSLLCVVFVASFNGLGVRVPATTSSP